MQLQGFPIDFHTFTWVRCMIKMFPHLPHFHLLSCIIQKLRRPGTWLIFVSTSFILMLYSSCVGELEMRSRIIFGVILFAAALYGELAAHYVWQFKSSAIEHQNISVDYALFDLMNSWCSLVSRQLFVACGMCWEWCEKWWKAAWWFGNEATVFVLCITIIYNFCF